MTEKLQVPTPRGLSGRGRRFWRETTGRYLFRPDELELLTEACRCMMLLDTIEAECLASPLLVAGTRGSAKSSPLLVELRLQRATLQRLLRGLRLPDDLPATSMGSTRSRAASHAANARWRGDGGSTPA